MGLLDPPGAPRPIVGRLRHIPTATGSQRFYYATDDCGGTSYQDVASGQWERIAPRGEVLSVESPVTSSYITSTSYTGISGAFMEMTPDRPMAAEIVVDTDVQIGRASVDTTWTTGERFAGIRLTENGVTVATRLVWAAAISASDLARTLSFRTDRRMLQPGVPVAYQLYYASQSASPTVNIRTQNFRMRVIEL